jgi:hypothetical protein
MSKWILGARLEITEPKKFAIFLLVMILVFVFVTVGLNEAF